MPGQHDATLPDSALRILHVRCPADVDPQVYRLLLGLVAEVTPVVQALPPSALVADVSGSLRYFGRDPSALARMIRTRALARYGLDVKIGVASTWALAAMASNETGPGGIRTVGAARAETEAFLYPRPVAELYGIGPAQARTLTTFGVHSVGILAALPEPTVQRILGGRTGRLIHEPPGASTAGPSSPPTSPTARAPGAASPSTPSTPPPSAPPCSPSPSSSATGSATATRPPGPSPSP
ncbi:DNA polymerase IV [Streptomyces cyaneofuscatus]|uniref:Y-family DNA polymerase n=1 Tax=Streptomyces cyaneofuscatus TaxID=66883 RepID=UPI001FD4D641|nr:hypothetical protein [Streptomyces cyaneofuscatus]